MSSGSAPSAVDEALPERAVASRPWVAALSWLGVLASAVLLTLSYPPWDLGGLIWCAFTPLIAAVWFGGRRSFLLGYVAGVIFFTATFHWLSSLGTLFEAPLLRGLPLLLAAYLALYPALWTWFLARVLVPEGEARRFPNTWQNLATGLFAASAWTVLEWVRGWLLSGFGWNGLGVALYRDLPMIQIADTVGTLGLSWLVAFVNVMIVVVVRRIVGELGIGFLKRVRWEFSLSVALVVTVFGYGLRQLFRAEPSVRATLKIAAIQPNIPQEQKFDAASEDKTLDTLERLTLMSAALKPDVILWPEAATPRGVFADQGLFDRFEKLRHDAGVPMLIGTVEQTVEESGPRFYNSAQLIPSGVITEEPPSYRKMHLVPFGEYLPLRPILNPIAGSLVPGDIDAGRDFTLFHLNGVDFSTLICFEDTLPDLTRRFVKKGAALLVNITNDGWFLRTCGAEQHLANATLRAVENRRPLVRCGNTGVTALVQPTGNVERWLEPHRESMVFKSVRIPDEPTTFYTRYGDWIVAPSLISVVGLMVWRRRRA